MLILRCLHQRGRYTGFPTIGKHHHQVVRRPGYNISIEPGITYNRKKVSIYAYVPIFIKHTILQGVPNREVKELTGVNITGGGGSGDWMIFLGFMVKL